MPMIASFAYFSYRPLSHNVLAVFPLIFISLLSLHQSFSAHARILKQNSKVQNLDVYLTATKNLIIVFLIFAAVSFSFQIPDRTQSPFSLKNIIENNLDGLSNVFFEIDDPERACKKNEENYQEFLSEVSEKTGVSFPENTPFIVLADFQEVSRFGNCFMNDKDEVKQRRIFYSSPLYNAPLPKDFSKELIKDYLTRHNTQGFFVFTSKHNETALHIFNSFMSQVPEEFKKEDITILSVKSDYIDGARVDAVSLELQYFRK